MYLLYRDLSLARERVSERESERERERERKRVREKETERGSDRVFDRCLYMYLLFTHFSLMATSVTGSRERERARERARARKCVYVHACVRVHACEREWRVGVQTFQPHFSAPRTSHGTSIGVAGARERESARAGERECVYMCMWARARKREQRPAVQRFQPHGDRHHEGERERVRMGQRVRVCLYVCVHALMSARESADPAVQTF